MEDVEVVEETVILKLIKKLINIAENGQSESQAFLSNTQLANILREEFQIEIEKKTEFEMEMYVNTLKKFLKLWPCWDELDQLVSEKKLNNDLDNIDAILKDRCVVLKEYLKDKLSIVETTMEPFNKRLQNKIEELKTEKVTVDDAPDVVMEIVCSRSQLNRLIFKHPINGTIFNPTDSSLNKITVNTFSLKEILNWLNIQVQLCIPGFECTRVNASTTKFTLVNLKRYENVLARNKPVALNNDSIFFKRTGNCKRQRRGRLLKVFHEMCVAFLNRFDLMDNKQIFKMLMEEFFFDFNMGPPIYNLGKYKFYLSKYPYARYLSVDPPAVGKEEASEPEYDLELQEILTPILTVDITSKLINTIECKKFDNPYFNSINFNNLVKVDCLQCETSYLLFGEMSELINHFNDNHAGELNWECTFCRESFPMSVLAKNRWSHQCKT